MSFKLKISDYNKFALLRKLFRMEFAQELNSNTLLVNCGVP